MAPNFVVDALFGSGLSRPLDPQVSGLLALATQRKVPLVAVDVPSGVMGDSGESQGAAASSCTVTFARRKPGHLLLPGRELCGDLVVADIGIPPAVLESLSIDTWENDPGTVAREAAAAAAHRSTSTPAVMRCCTVAIP